MSKTYRRNRDELPQIKRPKHKQKRRLRTRELVRDIEIEREIEQWEHQNKQP
jgi:hypothetical protein